MVQPYKSELLPHWKFAKPDIARKSSEALRGKFEAYLGEDDFVGCDLCLKFILMGHTRARRYANHSGGKKYKTLDSDEEAPKGVKVKSTVTAKGRAVRKVELPRAEEDPIKAESARIFKAVWEELREDAKYQSLLANHLEAYDAQPLPEDLEPYLEPEDWLEEGQAGD
jgi:hypothetical protein